MASAVMRPLSASHRMQTRWSDRRSTATVVDTFIKPNDRLTSFERLEIYNRQYWFRIIDCLHDDYPGLRAVLGQRRFLKLALAYLERHPSTRFTLRDLGQHLVAFILDETHWTHPRTRLAGEMARLEWAHVEAFDNEAKASLNANTLTGRNPSDIHLALQPYITLLQLSYPLDEFLISLRRQTGLRAESSNAVEAVSKPSPLRAIAPPARKTVCLAVHRHENRVYYKRLKPAQYELLSLLRAGKSLEAALQGLRTNVRPHQMKTWFTDWMVLGWFCGKD